MSEKYIFKFDNRNDNSFKNIILCIAMEYGNQDNEEDKKRIMDSLEDTAKDFFSEYGCDTKGKNCARYALKRPKNDDKLACIFFPVVNLIKENTGKLIDLIISYMRFNGIEPNFDDYIRINTELKEQYDKRRS